MPAQPLLHADADAFFASVEARDAPELADRPFVVLAGEHPIVACASYPARAFGVRGGMGLPQAQRLCPALTAVPARAAEYERSSQQLLELFEQYATAVEPGSMEEAFLDVGRRDPVVMARRLRTAVREQVGLPLSVGVGRTKLIAKLASRRAKPDGLLVVLGSAEERLRDLLALADVWGVGAVTRERLCAIGIHTLRDLDQVDEPTLAPVVGRAMARRLCGMAAGTDDAVVRAPEPSRQLAAERSVIPASRSRTAVHTVLDAALLAAGERLHRRGALAGRVEVLVTFDDGTTTAVRAPVAPTDVLGDLAAAARELLDSTGFASDGRGVRKVRVTVTLHRPAPRDEWQPALPFG